jgi:hypothetical protein
VAARTARTRRAEYFNSFTADRHASVFEVVRVAGLDTETIQKLMSAPVLFGNGTGTLGVIQVSRKAPSPAAAGPDFAADDLRKLESVALSVGKLMEEQRRTQATSG